jgi:hypothetical protein
MTRHPFRAPACRLGVEPLEDRAVPTVLAEPGGPRVPFNFDFAPADRRTFPHSEPSI